MIKVIDSTYEEVLSAIPLDSSNIRLSCHQGLIVPISNSSANLFFRQSYEHQSTRFLTANCPLTLQAPQWITVPPRASTLALSSGRSGL